MNTPAPLDSQPPSHRTLGNTIAAHLDLGAMVTAVIGFLMVFLVYSGVGKLDRLADQVSQLNERMASIIARNEFQEKTDEQQDDHLEKQDERLREIERVLQTR